MLGTFELPSSEWRDRVRAAAVFDPEFYLRSYADVARAGEDPLVHYLTFGWREERNPSATFNTRDYLDANQAVKAADICPLLHYIDNGILQDKPLQPPPSEKFAKEVAAAFSEVYYLKENPDVAEARVDALCHYLGHGWLEGRNPNPTFNTRKYLEEHPYLVGSGVCPLIDFALHRERAQPCSGNSGRVLRDAINTACPVVERSWPWLHREPPPVVDEDSFLLAMRAIDTSIIPGFAVSFSHDDYVTNAGGVENVVSDDENAFRALGWVYLHLCPVQALPVLADETPARDFLISVRVNGDLLGPIDIKTLIKALGDVHGSFRRVFILHHLLGFVPELIPEMAEAFHPDEVISWVHDFFTLCSSYTLLRNNVTYCGAPDLDSGACGICAYGGSERRRHTERMHALFERLQPTVLAPSAVALQLWLTRGRLPHSKAIVAPHGTLVMDQSLRSTRRRQSLRIGFAGGANFHKGWHVFRDLADRHYSDPRYSFVHLGTRRSEFYNNVMFVEISVNRDQRALMIDALREHEIDIVINWSLCFETFSFTTYEALAGGAFVIARKLAGNITPVITDKDVRQGIGLDTEDELFDLFATGQVMNLIQNARFGTFEIQAGTAKYISGLQS
ncbi:hypothetical protein FNL55_19635 [Tardiphaga sp. vice352]|uniref:hypothetical protein n=1 Tax=Tardiphaga sp. vice352 TaxID=2592816 RepID=UPI001162209E|nr:hypothetical protein [Tardiphaga sp. vice352]QDM33325.1 hypothetical protein FNL55_19635 [Tardiphaga sp. vice352]